MLTMDFHSTVMLQWLFKEMSVSLPQDSTVTQLIGHFQVVFCLYIKMSLHVKPFMWQWVSLTRSFPCKLNSFSHERLCTGTCFGTEAKGNSDLIGVMNCSNSGFTDPSLFTTRSLHKEIKKTIRNSPDQGFTSTPLHNSPFLRQGNLKSFTRPKSSPVTKTSFWKLASQALMSLVSVYFSQIPFTSTPRTPVQVAQWIALTSSLFAVRLPP